MRISIRTRLISVFVGILFIQILLMGAFFLYQNNTFSFVFLSVLTTVFLGIFFCIAWTTNKKVVVPLQTLVSDSATMLLGGKNTISLSADAEFQELANVINNLNLQRRQSKDLLEKEVKKRRIEEKAATTAKLSAEKANQAKSIYLANMSHEIRTPLHGMVAMLEMLGKDPLNDYQKQLLSMATLSGYQLQTVISSILDLSQIESGKLKLHRSPFTLSKLLSEVIDLLHIQTEKNNIDITSDLSDDIPNNLNGDSGRIRQILINLISNSIKFSKKGPIKLTVKLQAQITGSKVELLFTLKDHGIGIPKEAQEIIFNAFNRGDIGAEHSIVGTGLGLSISADFVEAMGGKLWLDESGLDGSTFCFTICCERIEGSSGELESNENLITTDKNLTDIHIFLAEDEFINQRIITAYLEEQGATVTVCDNGQDLLDTMESTAADIILMDIRMPVMNGLEATKIIRQREKAKKQPSIPIVALTAQATTDFEEKCRKAGMDEYVTKPIPFERLEKIICELVKE